VVMLSGGGAGSSEGSVGNFFLSTGLTLFRICYVLYWSKDLGLLFGFNL